MNIKMKNKSLSNSSIKRLKKMIKTELSIVYITTSNKVFLHLEEALESQMEEEEEKAIKRKKREKIMKVYEILSRILSKNEWGIFFKGEPIEGFPTQDGMKMYKVNEVASDRLFDAIEKEITETERECQGDSEQQTGGESSIG
tara:strand:- start:2134 stop:2562 length:429 start_codon:yes stop_codon:yes gene_type:complete